MDNNKGFNSMLIASWIMAYSWICEQNNKTKEEEKKIMYLEHHEIINKIA